MTLISPKWLRMRSQFCLSGLGLVLAIGVSAPAIALPGQEMQKVIQRFQNHPLLPSLTRGVSELSGQPYYTTQANTNAGTVVFTASPVSGTKSAVDRETIAYSTRQSAPNLEFLRTNAAGLGLIQSVYDPTIATDFQRSRYVARVDFTEREQRFYRGQRFGYITTQFKNLNQQGDRFVHFTVIPLGQLNSAIAAEQSCRRQSPDGCLE
jgi:hypothetical protein